MARGHPTDVKSAVLRNGSAVLVRQVNGNDAPLLADGFARLSEQSRSMRFLFAKKVLSAAELPYLTEVDHRHEALGAVAQDTAVNNVPATQMLRASRHPASARWVRRRVRDGA